LKGIYYTDGIIENKSSLAKLCVIFDELSTFQLSSDYYLHELAKKMRKPSGLKRFDERIQDDLLTDVYNRRFESFLEENKELINAKVLNPIVVKHTPSDIEDGVLYGSTELNKEVFSMFYYWGRSIGLIPSDKGYIDTYWYVVHRWKSLFTGLNIGVSSELIPISDNRILSSVACQAMTEVGNIPLAPSIDETVSKVAFSALSVMFPEFPELRPKEILKVRYKLKDEIGYFRQEVRDVVIKSSVEELYDIDDLVKKKIEPRINDIELKIKSERDSLFRKISSMFIAGGSVTSLAAHYFNLPSSGRVIGISSLIGSAALNVHSYKTEIRNIKQISENRGLVFLLEMKKRI